jgi:hypothetical protein
MSPSSPTALNGKQSTYQQHKDAKAFDFVSDMLKKKYRTRGWAKIA